MPNLDTLWSAVMYDASPSERARVARLLYRVSMAAFAVWALGLFSVFGMKGFATANEIDQKIAVAIEPIKKQLNDIQNSELARVKEKLEVSERMQRRILAAQISAQLRDLNRLRCSTGDTAVRSRMEQDIEAADHEYKLLTGERYPLPACKEL